MLQSFNFFFLGFRKFIGLKNSGILKMIGPVIILHTNIHCKNHNSVTQVTDEAHWLLDIKTYLTF